MVLREFRRPANRWFICCTRGYLLTVITHYEQFSTLQGLFKDLSMLHRALWDRGHEGVTRLVQWRIRVGFDILWSRHLQAKFRSSHWRIVLCKKFMHGFVGQLTVTPLWRHNDSGVIKPAHDMDANMCKWEILWKLSFVNHASTNFIEINSTSNTNLAPFCNE